MQGQPVRSSVCVLPQACMIHYFLTADAISATEIKNCQISWTTSSNDELVGINFK
jgi:hypothetical protein